MTPLSPEAPSAALPCAVAAPAVLAPAVRAPRGARSRRIAGLAVAIASAALLALAAALEPSPGGLGTHSQLSLPPCGWIVTMDLPCPTCGMTTAFAHAANGDLLASFGAQPLGAALALSVAMALILGAYVAATGSRVAGELPRLWSPAAGWLLGAAGLAAWAYKILSYRGIL